MRKLLLVSILILLQMAAYPQNGWRSERHGFALGLGGNIFMGDLGGGNKNNNHIFAFGDVDPNFLKFSGMLSYSYRLSERLSMRLGVLYSEVGADDANSKSESRRKRNLNFKSQLIDMGINLDYYFVREKVFSRYESASFASKWAAYFTVGLGGLHYNPKGKYEGQWYDLQPLCTEGQGTGARFVAHDTHTVTQAGQKYSLMAVSIPIGLGVKFQLSGDMSVGIEIAQRFTTTDYIDDCSAYYFNYDEMGIEPPSEATRYFAYKSIGSVEGIPSTGSPRGNSGYNDSYFTGMITFCYKFLRGKD